MLDTLHTQYKNTNLQLLRLLLSDDEDSDGDSTSQHSNSPHTLSSPISSMRSISPISESDLSSPRIRDSSLAPILSSDDEDIDIYTDPLRFLYQKVLLLQDKILSTRYLQQRVPIPSNSQLDLLWWYKENSAVRFRRKVRISPDTFDHILLLISDHAIFTNRSSKEQIPVGIQFAIFLNRVGHYGNAASVDDIAEWAGVSAGTVLNATKRCMIAIIELHHRALSLPTSDEKAASKSWCEWKVIPEWREGWLAVDGTTIPLFQKPGLHGEAWFDKSSNYSMNAQFVLLLHNLRIVDYALGHTGSAHDSYAFQATRIAKNPTDFLSDGEWMWADSAYPIRTWCVPPFRKPRNGELSRTQKKFNYHLSSVRVRSEHAIGLLKGRFQSLRELRIQIGSHELHKFTILWIRCCVILHNLIIQFEDESMISDDTWRERCIFSGLHDEGDCNNPDYNFYDADGEAIAYDDEEEVSDEPVPSIAQAGAAHRDRLVAVLLSSLV